MGSNNPIKRNPWNDRSSSGAVIGYEQILQVRLKEVHLMWGILPQQEIKPCRKGLQKHWAKLHMPRARLQIQREMLIQRWESWYIQYRCVSLVLLYNILNSSFIPELIKYLKLAAGSSTNRKKSCFIPSINHEEHRRQMECERLIPQVSHNRQYISGAAECAGNYCRRSTDDDQINNCSNLNTDVN